MTRGVATAQGHGDEYTCGPLRDNDGFCLQGPSTLEQVGDLLS